MKDFTFPVYSISGGYEKEEKFYTRYVHICIIFSRSFYNYPIVGVEGYCCTLSHTYTHTVRLPWTSDQQSQRCLPTQQAEETNTHASNGIRTCDSSNRGAVDLRLEPHCHRDRSRCIYIYIYIHTHTHTHTHT